MTFARLLCLAALFLAALSPARAGDVANLQILGFSADGGIFAFEEYGEGDGSGFPYANRFYIDTSNDSFVSGTPIRVLIEDETVPVETARTQARAKGEAVVPSAVLAANPGFTAGYNAVTEYSADPFRMLVNPRPIFSPVDPPLEFRLEEFPVIAPEGCESMGDIVGFRLLRIDSRPGGVTTVVHEDKKIPASRGCPLGYRIGAVQTWMDGEYVFAVLLSVISQGFEGPDYRWIAVTGKF
jgi:predicted secreted protein